MKLKIRKTRSGTYYIPSISIKEIRKMAKMKTRRWHYLASSNEILIVGTDKE